MLRILHYLLCTAFLVAPLAAVLVDVYSARRQRRHATAAPLLISLCGGVVLGTSIVLAYAFAVGGRASLWQLLLAVYFATSLLLILKAFDWGVRTGAAKAWHQLFGRGRQTRLRRVLGDAVPQSVRILLLIGVGLPYILAAVMTYRPKVVPRDDPLRQLGFTYQTVQFETSDGLSLSGWWIPASSRTGRRTRDSDRTVVVCHGLAANKSNQLVLARQLVPGGYNVLIFDFRAHGQSEGQLTTFGARERLDVLAAVRWLRHDRPEQARHVYGVGASMGAAALIAAAADASPEGQAIEAVAVYGTYDDLGSLARHLAHNSFLPPLNWLAASVSLPLASAQVGVNLLDFRPADLIQDIWPRPVMVIHGYRDEIIPFEHGQRLYDAAYPPRRDFWIPRGFHNDILNDEGAAGAVKRFFDEAEPMPVI